MLGNPPDEWVLKHENRIAILETKLEEEKKSLFSKMSKWGGLVALVISLMTGIYTIYDNFIKQPKLVRESKLMELSDIIEKMMKLNSTLIEVNLSNNPELLYFASKNISAHKINLLNRADELIRAFPDVPAPTDYMILAQENLNFGNSAIAIRYTEKSLEISKTLNSHFSKIEAYRFRGMAYFAPGKTQNLELARSSLEIALDLTASSQIFNKEFYQLDLIVSWINLEAAFGDCKDIKSQYDQFKKLHKNPILPTAQKDVLLKTVNDILNNQTKCPASYFES